MAALPALLIFAAGCPGPGQLQSVLDQQVEDVLGQLINDFVLVRVVNQTNNDIQLDLLVDGVQQTISCSSLLQVCDLPLTTCPQTVEAVAQRSLDAQGRFVGGRIFNGNDAFKFTQADGEINCTSVIVYKFTEAGAEAFDI